MGVALLCHSPSAQISQRYSTKSCTTAITDVNLHTCPTALQVLHSHCNPGQSHRKGNWCRKCCASFQHVIKHGIRPEQELMAT